MNQFLKAIIEENPGAIGDTLIVAALKKQSESSDLQGRHLKAEAEIVAFCRQWQEQGAEVAQDG